MEDVSTVRRVLGAEGVVFVRLDDVQPGLVLVHRVENDLRAHRTRHIKQEPRTPSTQLSERLPVLACLCSAFFIFFNPSS